MRPNWYELNIFISSHRTMNVLEEIIDSFCVFIQKTTILCFSIWRLLLPFYMDDDDDGYLMMDEIYIYMYPRMFTNYLGRSTLTCCTIRMNEIDSNDIIFGFFFSFFSNVCFTVFGQLRWIAIKCNG